jgi:hypothetical protein
MFFEVQPFSFNSDKAHMLRNPYFFTWRLIRGLMLVLIHLLLVACQHAGATWGYVIPVARIVSVSVLMFGVTFTVKSRYFLTAAGSGLEVFETQAERLLHSVEKRARCGKTVNGFWLRKPQHHLWHLNRTISEQGPVTRRRQRSSAAHSDLVVAILRDNASFKTRLRSNHRLRLSNSYMDTAVLRNSSQNQLQLKFAFLFAVALWWWPFTSLHLWLQLVKQSVINLIHHRNKLALN